MESGRLFTQSDRHVASRRRRQFGLAGALPILLLTAVLTWFGAVGSMRTGIAFRQVMFGVPGVLAIQLLVTAFAFRRPERLVLRLSPESLELGGGHAPVRRYGLAQLEQVRVVRRGNQVLRLVLRFTGSTLRLEGFYGMDTLRDLLVLYAGTPKGSKVRVLDPQHRVERNMLVRRPSDGEDTQG